MHAPGESELFTELPGGFHPSCLSKSHILVDLMGRLCAQDPLDLTTIAISVWGSPVTAQPHCHLTTDTSRWVISGGDFC